VVVLAISGGLQASIKQLDIVGFLLVAAAAGIGGGTLRDLLLYDGPVFWVREPPCCIDRPLGWLLIG
jgi:uncharacterized membrane protein YeiH